MHNYYFLSDNQNGSNNDAWQTAPANVEEKKLSVKELIKD
jgi:hypothetical protein